MASRGTRSWLVGRLPVYVAAAAVLILVLFPLLTVVRASLLPRSDLWARPSVWVSSGLSLQYYAEVVRPGYIIPVGRAIVNTAVVSSVTAVLTVLLASPAAYAFARLPVPRKGALLPALLSVSLLPSMLFLIPIFVLMRTASLLDTYPSLIIPYTVWSLPVITVILTSFFRTIPQEIEDAGLVDGCSRLQLLRHVVGPLAAPGLVAALVISLIGAWNEFLTPLILTGNLKVITTVLGMFTSTYEVQLGQLSAAGIYAVLPVIVLTLVFQRQIQRGIVEGAIR